MSDYTPTTENVRVMFSSIGADRERNRAAFDRWLAQVKAALLTELADEIESTKVGLLHHDLDSLDYSTLSAYGKDCAAEHIRALARSYRPSNTEENAHG